MLKLTHDYMIDIAEVTDSLKPAHEYHFTLDLIHTKTHHQSITSPSCLPQSSSSATPKPSTTKPISPPSSSYKPPKMKIKIK